MSGRCADGGLVGVLLQCLIASCTEPVEQPLSWVESEPAALHAGFVSKEHHLNLLIGDDCGGLPGFTGFHQVIEQFVVSS
ncbi:hypothetical protein [Herbaspirillum huttiense]|uniref:hypothetical protein n=1 Tax=Herbaspirillum huttiense TaxID=863372 RepID=UPI002176D547|nr:hypothetical protein [Herbaspirillum huttiense]UWE18823.1 hypothetical protein NY669_11805 [Herbaspirillum huttiense]